MTTSVPTVCDSFRMNDNLYVFCLFWRKIPKEWQSVCLLLSRVGIMVQKEVSLCI